MKRVFFSSTLLFFLCWNNSTTVSAERRSPISESKQIIRLTLEDCITIALKNNQLRPTSEYAVLAAEAQHKQAMSAYWPHIHFRSTFQHFDENPNFIFPPSAMAVPASTINVPSSTIKVPASSFTIPANAFGPGFPPAPVTIPVSSQTFNVPGQQFTVPAQTFNVPEQKIALFDKDIMINSFNLSLPLFTGGKRSSLLLQAKYGMELSKIQYKRTELKIIFDVKRMYYGCVLAKIVSTIGQDALDRLESTLELTEKLYKKSSGSVKKTDYLRTKVIVNAVRSAVIVLQNNEEISRAALINTMGLPWDTQVELVEAEIPYAPYSTNLKELISSAYCFSLDLKSLDTGLKAAQAQVKEAKSGYFPKIALTGSLNYLENSYEYGLMSRENETFWTVGIGMHVPLFEGFLTKNKIKETRARLKKLQSERILLKEGLALQIKNIFLHLDRSVHQYESLHEAVTSAEENCKLNIRAYQDELVETNEVIEAQLMESFMKSRYYKNIYDHAEAQAQLDFVIGKAVTGLLKEDKNEN